ncbi:MAG: tripartite tricarboxylate transporter substrate binding protein [Pseudomonadota bacterium]
MHPTLTRRNALALAAGTALLGRPAWAAAGWKPADTVEYVVPSGAGAALDMAARRLGHILEEQKSARTVVVNNKSGANGLLALHVLQQNEGNANYFVSLSASYLTGYATGVLPVSYQDFTPLAVLMDEFVAVAVRADSPIRSGRDLAERLRRDPQALSIGIASALGNHIHIGIARPLKLGGVEVGKLTVAPFKSSAESLNALLGGHIDIVSCSTPNVVAQLAAGRIRVIAVDAPKRLGGALAQVPTWKEQGFDVVGLSSQGILAPKGIGADAQAYWTQALRKATQAKEWQEFLATNQLRPHFLAGDDATALLDAQATAFTHALHDLGLVDAGAVGLVRGGRASKA